MKPTLEDLTQATHVALRSWHSRSPAELPWRDMLVVRQHIAAQLVPDLGRAVKEVVLQGLNTLEQQAGGDAVKILRLRFLDDLTAQATANQLNLTENVVYKQQRTAIRDLAAIIEQAESDARRYKAAGVLERLEIQEPPHLFGVEDKLADLLSILAIQQSPWLVVITGIGGIGKTSLADAAVRSCAQEPNIASIAWVSARQDRFTFWKGVENLDETPALTTEELVDTLVSQLGFHDLTRLPLKDKQTGLRARLKAMPYLIVVDNLETAADYNALIPDLKGLVNPTRFLLTSRHELREHSGMHHISLDELSAGDSLALLRHEAGERGLADVASAPEVALLQLFQVAGGNPLALKLLLGQIHALSLPKVVDDLRRARGQTVEDLYHFIYWHSWSLLSDEARQVLTIMPLVAENGGEMEQLAELGKLPEDQLAFALRQLVAFSLVNVRGTMEERRYSIHRLTETFLLNEVLKWQMPA